MKQDDIIRMAKEADVWVAGQEPYQTQLERFAALVAAAEREACAKVSETLGVHPALNVYNGGPEWYKHGKEIAAAIRARGNNETQTLQDTVRNP